MTRRPASSYAAALALLLALSLAGCGDDDGTAGNAADPATVPTAVPATPVTPQTPQASATTTGPASPSGSATVAAPLYFVGDTPQGPRLFREFQQVEADNPADEALARLAAGDTVDPDYRTLLPAGAPTVASPAASADTIEIALPDASWATRPAGMTGNQAKLAVQQLVHTVQGLLQRRDAVAFTLDGATSTVLGLPGDAVRAGEELDTLALVNVTAPEQGAVVSGSFTATGLSSSFEGTTPFELRSADGTVVVSGAAQAEGYIDKLYPWTTDVDLAGVTPGDYTFAVRTDDPSDGEGPGPTEDTKAITVQ